MAVASLVIAILSVILFCWAGPMLGAAWAGVAVASSFGGDGPATIVTWPVWTLGLAVGVGIPLLAVMLGIVGLRDEKSKGISLAGIIVGLVAAILGLMGTLIAVGFYNVVDDLSADSDQMQQFQQQLQQQLDDPAALQRIQDQLKRAARQGQDPGDPMKPMTPVEPDETDKDEHTEPSKAPARPDPSPAPAQGP